MMFERMAAATAASMAGGRRPRRPLVGRMIGALALVVMAGA